MNEEQLIFNLDWLFQDNGRLSKDMMDGKPLSGRILDSAQFLRGGCGVSTKT